jgi:hypothetical protein
MSGLLEFPGVTKGPYLPVWSMARTLLASMQQRRSKRSLAAAHA